MRESDQPTPLSRDEYEGQLAAYVASEKAKLAEKPTGFFGNWGFHAAMKAEFDKHLHEAGIGPVQSLATASPVTFRLASLRSGEAQEHGPHINRTAD